MKSVAILSTIGSSLLVPVIESFHDASIDIRAILMDGALNKRDKNIEKSRVDPCYEIKSLKDLNLSTTPFYFLSNHNSHDCISLIQELKVNYLVSAGTPRILNETFLNSVPGVINCHPGVLPKYRGCTCVEWAIFNDDPVGATAHFMVPQIDAGPIILSKIMEISEYETYETIRTRMIFHQAELLSQAVSLCFKEKILLDSLPMQPNGTYYKPISINLLLTIKTKLAQGKYKSHV